MELILGDYNVDEIQLVTKILEQKPPLVKSRLAQEMGVSVSKIKKLFKRVRRDWRFSVQVNYHAIGLRKIIFLLNGRPETIEERYLTLYATTIEGNIILSYFIPVIHEPQKLIEMYRDYLRYYVILDGSYEPRPRLMNYYSSGRIMVNLYEEIRKAFEENAWKSDIRVNTLIKRFNEVDLRIIVELQKDPLRSVNAIAKALGYTAPRVSGHIRFLAKNDIIESFSLKALPHVRRYLGDLVFATIIIGIVPSKYPLKRLAKSLSSIPLIGTAIYGGTLVERTRNQIIEYNERIIYIPILTFEKIIDYVHEIVDLIREYIEIYDVIIAMRKQRFSLPYKQEEYSKYKGFWKI